jgi:hypothetical protein
MPKATWSIAATAFTAVTAIMSTMFLAGDFVSHATCDPHQSEFVPWNISWALPSVTVFFASAAAFLGYHWSKSGLVINSLRTGFILLCPLYVYIFKDQLRLFSVHSLVFTSCSFEDWNDLEFFELMGLIVYGPPIFLGAAVLTGMATLAFNFQNRANRQRSRGS